MLHTDSIYEM